MQECEVCGRESNLVKTVVEGTTLHLCSSCTKFGRVIEEREISQKKEGKREILIKHEEGIHDLAPDFFKKIREAREKKGMTQEELGKSIAEKVSVIQKIETGKFEPPLDTVKKLERFFGMKFTEDSPSSSSLPFLKKDEEPLTIGDIFKNKNEKT